ncbi:lamin tail domain-containing protein [Algibacter pectinivorans]|uniref:Por secretion system C-terminal sorting domain-containing protein n=1 Tax=Algibacter pectinivorans TaxID=870482 RepID=A0A1I1N902_9FLAO|nr:lamin tail domain-containing protein [Algibacter pectinivorans]SFC93945.1 Por secretion system C-terminal sorting domain-containing protein [Algibacter pectinivorans]
MKKITLVLVLLLAFDFGFGQTSDLIISEYGEGSSFNKYIEIFNGTGADVDLADYELWRAVNGGTWLTNTISLSGILTNGSVYVIAHPSSDPTILAVANITTGSALWNGNDATGLAKDDGTGTFFLIDVIGTDGADPGTGWDVAGTTNATANHTLVRKNSICDPNTNWSTSAGTTVTNSEWVVLVIDDWSDIGTHTTSCCISTTIYTGSWSSGPPDSLTKSVVISSDYTTTTEDIVGCSLTVDAGAILTIANGTFAEIENDVTINGTLVVETQGNFVQRDNAGTFTNNGTSRVNKTTATKAAWYYYTYWSSPVVGETTTNVFPDVDGDRRFWFNAVNFVDTNNDNIDDNADAWQYALATNGTDNMLPGVGYAVTEDRLFSNFAPGTGSASFEGEFNTGDIDTNISFNTTNRGTNWNFIGNPYPSAVDFEAFYAANAGVVDGTAYFWSQATPPSGANPGNEQSNFSRNDYAMYAAGSGGGVAGASEETPTQYIPSGQGFFIAGLANMPATFTNAMRMADVTSNTQFFKNSSAKQNTAKANRLWVNLTSDNGIFNQILVAYVDGATNGIDNGAYDAKRFLTPDFNTTLYSIIKGSNTKFAIQGKAINSLTEDEIINLGFATNIDVATLYTFSIAQLEGDFLGNNIIYLKDNLLNKVHNLSDSDYSFTSEVGEFNDRFEILFKANTTLSIDNNTLDAKALKIVELNDNHVQFTASKNITAVGIFDLLGRQLYQFSGNATTATYKLSQLNSGSIYIAKVELSSGAIITKKAVKK